jgi:hypothetical protein
VGAGEARASDVLSVTLAPGGGYIARFTPDSR